MAARYFRAFPGLLPDGWTFPGRQRRPPPDPVNALLSFGYVLVANELQSLLDAIGFDPYLGFFHEVDYGSPSLALDLLEEFRAPLVDRFAATLLALGRITRPDFVAGPEGGVVLSREGLKTFFTAWEHGLAELIALDEGSASFRELFRRQAERLARALTQGEPYRTFRLSCDSRLVRQAGRSPSTKITVLEGFRRTRVQCPLSEGLSEPRPFKRPVAASNGVPTFQTGRAIWWVGRESSRNSFLDRRLAQAEEALAEAECIAEDA